MLYYLLDNSDTCWPDAATENTKKAFGLYALNMDFSPSLQREIIVKYQIKMPLMNFSHFNFLAVEVSHMLNAAGAQG